MILILILVRLQCQRGILLSSLEFALTLLYYSSQIRLCLLLWLSIMILAEVPRGSVASNILIQNM